MAGLMLVQSPTLAQVFPPRQPQAPPPPRPAHMP